MEWGQILISAVLGFFLGYWASAFGAGGRKMIAPIFFKRKLHIGAISKDSLDSRDGSTEVYWYMPVEVKASNWWKLAVGDIEVRARIGYTEKNGNDKLVSSTWVETITDVPSITLRIGDIDRGVIVAITSNEQLLPLMGRTEELFKDDQDITLELTSGKTTLGRWRFPKAIVQGVMQEVSPIKIKREGESMGKRIQSKLWAPHITKKAFHTLLNKACQPIKKSEKEKS